MTKKNKILISFWIEPDTLKVYDLIAQKARISRSKVIHNMVKVGFEEMELQKNFGLLKVNILLRQLKKKLPPIVNEAQKKQVVLDDTSKRKENVSVRFDPDLITKIDYFAKNIDLTRKSFIEYVLDTELREHKIITSIPGALDSVVILRDFLDTIRRNWKNSFKRSENFIETKTLNLNDSENGSE